MKKVLTVIMVLFLSINAFSQAPRKQQLNFIGWLEINEFTQDNKPIKPFLDTAFKLDTSLVQKSQWDELSSQQVEVQGHFYIDTDKSTIFKVTKISPLTPFDDTDLQSEIGTSSDFQYESP